MHHISFIQQRDSFSLLISQPMQFSPTMHTKTHKCMNQLTNHSNTKYTLYTGIIKHHTTMKISLIG